MSEKIDSLVLKQAKKKIVNYFKKNKKVSTSELLDKINVDIYVLCAALEELRKEGKIWPENSKMTFDRVFNYNRYEHFFEIGDFVKLRGSNINESFWVVITEASGGDDGFTNDLGARARKPTSHIYFKGRIDNHLIDKRYGDYGDVVEFDISHIINLYIEKN